MIVTLTVNPAIDISAVTDEVRPISKLRCREVRRDPGGGGINVARVVKRLGGDVIAIYTAGGSIGQLLRNLVAHESIPSITIDIATETREDFTVHEKKSGAQFRFVVPGNPLQEGEWEHCLDAVASFAEVPSFIVASGSLAPGMPEDFYARVARLARQSGARFVVDTSGPALAAALEEGVHLVKPSLSELRGLTGAALEDEASWVKASRHLIEAGRAEIVTLTLGDRGALMVTDSLALRSAPIKVEEVSAVGAGDSFLGGMVWALTRGEDMETAFRYAVAAGTAAVLTPGTGLSLPPDVMSLYEKVVIEAV